MENPPDVSKILLPHSSQLLTEWQNEANDVRENTYGKAQVEFSCDAFLLEKSHLIWNDKWFT